jgi:hypothetical protein
MSDNACFLWLNGILEEFGHTAAFYTDLKGIPHLQIRAINTIVPANPCERPEPYDEVVDPVRPRGELLARALCAAFDHMST